MKIGEFKKETLIAAPEVLISCGLTGLALWLVSVPCPLITQTTHFAINIFILISDLAQAMSICTLDLDVLMMEDPWLSTLVRHLY